MPRQELASLVHDGKRAQRTLLGPLLPDRGGWRALVGCGVKPGVWGSFHRD